MIIIWTELNKEFNFNLKIIKYEKKLSVTSQVK